MRTKIVSLAGVLLSAGFVLYIVQRFDMKQVLHTIMDQPSPAYLLLAVVVYVALFPLRGLRWSILIEDVRPIGWWLATEIFLVGFMANNLLPARLGDVARAYALTKRADGVSADTVFSNVMLERIFDGLTVVGLLLMVLVVAPPEAAWVRHIGWIAGMIFAGAISVCALVTWNEERALALADFFLRPMPSALREKVFGFVHRLAKGLHPLRNPACVAKVLALSVAIWCSEVLVYAIAQRAFGMQVPGMGLFLVMSMLTLGLSVPSSPGFVGVYEGIVIQGLSVYGIGAPVAPAFAITLHVIHYVPGTVLGLLCLWRLGLKLRELKDAGAHRDD